jgi:BirA family transcriptional regulator, biotin operon repressor / biotin---[acetyl-CoA-carboxylase] ligase
VNRRADRPAPTTTSPVLGHPRVHLRRIGSTNDHARALAIAGAPHGTLVSAAEQTAGRGRQGRRWSAPAGSAVLASLVLRSPPPLLPLLAAVAVCDVAGERALIKWPNDVVVPERAAAGEGRAGDGRAGEGHAGERCAQLAKLAGILVEGRPQEDWAVLGIGINVAVDLDDLPPRLRAGKSRDGGAGDVLPAATLGLAPAAVEPTLARLLRALERRLDEPSQHTLTAWRARDALYGREIAWGTHAAVDGGQAGRAAGIDGEGRLLVELAGRGRVALDAGEVHLQRIA